MEASEEILEKTLRKLRILFLWTGLKLHDQTNPNQLFYIFNCVWLHLAMMAATSFMIRSIISGTISIDLLFVAPCMTFTLLANTKALCYKTKISEFHQLIDGLMKLEKQDSTNVKTVNKIKDTEITFLHKVINVFLILTCLMIFVFNVSPLPLIALTYYSTGKFKLFLPFQDVYPLDALNIYCWPFAYIHQFWSG